MTGCSSRGVRLNVAALSCLIAILVSSCSQRTPPPDLDAGASDPHFPRVPAPSRSRHRPPSHTPSFMTEQPLRGETVGVPEGIVAKGRAFVVGRLGQAFVARSVQYSPERSYTWVPSDTTHPVYHVVTFELSVEDAPFVSRDVAVWFDHNGVLSHEPEALPFCARWPQECEFPIDAAGAFAIAADLGMPVDIGEWRASFYWDRESACVWRVTSPTRDKSGARIDRWHVTIDANTGVPVDGPHCDVYRYDSDLGMWHWIDCEVAR